jgi:hypothetical protein
MNPNNHRIFSPEQEAWVRSIVPGKTGIEQSEMIRRRYGIRLTPKQLSHWRKNHHASSGLTGRFEKGHPSPNKGVPMPRHTYEMAKATMFKKGQKPWNDRFKIGDRRIVRWNGNQKRWYEKVSDEGTLWERWKPVARIVLEKAGTPCPEDSVVIHLDKNPLNDDLGNLFIVKKSIYGPMQRMHIMGRDEAAMKAAELIVKIGHKAWALKEKRRAENKRRKKHAAEHSD